MAFGDGWDLWRWTCLRGAGFPIDLVTPLADSECARLAVEALQCADEAGQCRDRLIATLAEAHRHASGERRKALSIALKTARKRRVPSEPIDEPGASALVEASRHADAARGRAWSALEAAFEQSRIRARTHLRELATSETFARAVLLQNRSGFRCAIAKLPLEEVEPVRRSSPGELLALNYLQRYATKNDTIGFFGPKCWVRIEPPCRGIDARFGRGVTRRCRVHFETWAIDSLARALQAEHDVARWLTPRRTPLISVGHDDIGAPGATPASLSPAAIAVLRASNGLRHAGDVASMLLHERGDLFRCAEDVHAVLEELQRSGLVTLRFELPLSGSPEQLLRRQVTDISDESIRAACLQQLDALERGRVAASVASTASALDEALGSVDTAFRQTTGEAPHRTGEQTPRGKGLLYCDCTRDADVTLGDDLFASCSDAIGLLLDSGRWFTHAVAAAYTREFENIFTRLAGDAARVGAAELWRAARPVLLDDDRALLTAVVKELQQRWREIVPLPEEQRCVTYRSAELRAGVRRLFDAPHAGWRYARYVSLDLHIAARSPDAIVDGRRRFVLGEIHLGNALNAGTFVTQHPSPDDLWSAVDHDRLGGRVIMLPPKGWPAATGRNAPRLEAPNDIRLVVDPSVHTGFDERTIAIGECVAERRDGRLVMRIPADGEAVPIAEAFATVLTHLVFNEFRPFAIDRHRPRLCIDDVVILREAWRFKAAELTFVDEADDRRQFADIQRWRAAQQLPRWCFVKLTGEAKPMYLDFDSPMLVELFVGRVRRSLAKPYAMVSLTEMLPEPGDEWLHDQQGHRYTSELRIVTVDRTPVGDDSERAVAGASRVSTTADRRTETRTDGH